MGQKTKKGEISIVDQGNGKSRLRFRYKGERYSINVESGESVVISKRIALEIAQGTFDILQYKSLTPGDPGVLNFKELYTVWVTKYKNGSLLTQSNFSQVLSLIGDDLPDISENTWSSSTYNRRLTTLKQFGEWLVNKGHIKENPYKDICKRKKESTLPKTNRKPLTKKEINLLLSKVKGHQYAGHYYNFLYVLFRTGMRNEEAVGLRVKHIDFESNLIHICEVMARGKQGTNAKYRIRKATKNGKERYIPMSGELVTILHHICDTKASDDLVFTSPNGLCIDDRMLQKRILKPIMRKLGFGERDLYVARHTFGSKAIERGVPLATVAELMGNTVETLVRHYVKVVEQPKELPEL